MGDFNYFCGGKIFQSTRMFQRLKPSAIRKLVPGMVFILSLLTYWLTVEPSASYWDCPEYLANALLLEPGHPPGNPFWMLTHRVAGSLFTDPSAAALAVNMASGLFSALAVAMGSILALTLLRFVSPGKGRGREIIIAVSAFLSSMLFAWTDSIWFSAVEAEVYAMSLFLTLLSLYIGVRMVLSVSAAKRSRLLILTAYLAGLSVGVHQLNLLVLPVIALMMAYRCRSGRRLLKDWLAIAAGALVVALLLKGLLHGTPYLASRFELLAVNHCGLPFNAGLLVWLILTGSLSFIAPFMANRRWVTSVVGTSAFLLSGIPLLGGDSLSGLIVTFVLGICYGVLAFRFSGLQSSYPQAFLWLLPMILTGFSSYSIIMIRSAANPPMNQGEPSNIFSFIDYLDRKQYGVRPLFYGKTPYSSIMRFEKITVTEGGDMLYSYTEPVRRAKGAVYRPKTGHPHFSARTGLRTAADSALNARLEKRHGDAYLIADRAYDLLYTPELNMIFPRITEGDPESLSAYAPWTGMTPATMVETEISEAVRADGSTGPRRGVEGKPVKAKSLRPTYMQNLRMLAGYQIGYMYFRYLLWNFGGRQNDRHSTGQAEDGNFVTGIDAVDSLMLGNQRDVPREIKDDNPGRNIYLMLPLLAGIAGLVVLLRGGRRGRRGAALIMLLFLLTGPAIAFYLNQNLGEARERDYSFLGSFFAFSLLIAVGFLSLLRCGLRRKGWMRKFWLTAGLLIAGGITVTVLCENVDDHDRSGRYFAEGFARHILESCPQDAILFAYGDNYTFPLWFAQEVMGVRPDVSVVNISYLSTDWYPGQISSDIRRGGAYIRMIGKKEDYAYGRYQIAGIGRDTAAYDPRDLLRKMFEMPDSLPPEIASLRIRLRSGEVIDFGERLGRRPGGFLTGGEVAMLDIIAGQLCCAKARPILWLKNIGPHKYLGLYDLTEEGLYTRRLSVGGDTCAGGKMMIPPLGKLTGKRDVYVDPTAGSVISFIRGNMLRLALRHHEEGEPRLAVALTDTILQRLPFTLHPSATITLADTLADEKIVLGELRRALGRELGDRKLEKSGESLIREGIRNVGEWRGYVNSLPESDRARLSPATRRRARINTN